MSIYYSKDIILNSKSEYINNCISRVSVPESDAEKKERFRKEEEEEILEKRAVDDFKEEILKKRRERDTKSTKPKHEPEPGENKTNDNMDDVNGQSDDVVEDDLGQMEASKGDVAKVDIVSDDLTKVVVNLSVGKGKPVLAQERERGVLLTHSVGATLKSNHTKHGKKNKNYVTIVLTTFNMDLFFHPFEGWQEISSH